MVQGEWMRGKCWDMAVALHRSTKLPLYGLFDANGQCHHAFVMTPNGRGIDARGTQSVERLKAGCAGQEPRPMTLEDVAKWVGRGLAAAEINAARRAINADPLLRTAVARIAAAPEAKRASPGN